MLTIPSNTLSSALKVFPDINLHHVKALLVRFWYEYRQLVKVQIVRDLLDRLIYLFAFGFGMGAVVKTMDGLPYLTFLVPGIAASTGVFVMTMATTFGVWERISNYKVWPAWLATPLRLPEILLAELIYANLRTIPSILILFVLAGIFMQSIPNWWGALASLPILFLANFAFGAVGLCFTAHIRRPLHFVYVNTLWTTPMFLCSGVFYDVKQAPLPLKILAEILPLKHVLSSVRPLMTGQPISLGHIAADVGVLALIALAGYLFALHIFQKRLLD